MRISDWSSDVCSSDLPRESRAASPDARWLARNSRKRLHQAVEEGAPVGAAEPGVGKALGMRHEAEHGLGLVVDAGDIAQRAVGIGLWRHRAVLVAVAERALAAGFPGRAGVVVGGVHSVAVGAGIRIGLALLGLSCDS